MKRRITQNEINAMNAIGMDLRTYNVYNLSHLVISYVFNIEFTIEKSQFPNKLYAEFMLKLKDAVGVEHLRVLALYYGLTAETGFYPETYSEIVETLKAKGMETICGHKTNVETIRIVLAEAERMVKFNRELRDFPFPWARVDKRKAYVKKQLAEIRATISKLKEEEDDYKDYLKKLENPNYYYVKDLMPLLDEKVNEIKYRVGRKGKVNVNELNFSEPVLSALRHEGIEWIDQLEKIGIQEICSFKNFDDRYCAEIVERLEEIGIII